MDALNEAFGASSDGVPLLHEAQHILELLDDVAGFVAVAGDLDVDFHWCALGAASC